VLLHVVAQACVVGSQAVLGGQSSGPLQPQPFAPHTEPRLLAAQLTQASPELPQALVS
jgi:hypothetical protein